MDEIKLKAGARKPAQAIASPSAVKAAAALATFLGLGLIWGVGFATPSSIHNAAHDTRHSLAFPCH